jgi:hypothetical protein
MLGSRLDLEAVIVLGHANGTRNPLGQAAASRKGRKRAALAGAEAGLHVRADIRALRLPRA